ncbi:MAG: hypothetical protein FJ091_18745 [Deltaproteobacteria bacterium]|nr:hypothetical protein [Deltaproteobacteria bacterium]
MRSQRARVFVSYDRAHDGDLRERLAAEARSGTLFTVAACSELATESDDVTLRERIGGADAVIVICGEHADESPAMCAELRVAREEQTPHLLLWGRRAAMCKKPIGARADEGMYGWTPEILRSQLHALMRAKLDVPAHLKRAAPPPKASE